MSAIVPSRLHAAGALVVAMALFAMMSALVKLVGTRFGLLELVFYLGAFASLVLVLMVPRAGGLQALRTTRPLGHMARSLCGLGGMAGLFEGVRRLPLAEATSLSFIAPVLTAALAGLLLRERVGLRRWLALAVGMVGALVILRPGSSVLSWGAPAVLGGALCGALAMISISRLRGTESGVAVALYYQLFCALVGGLSLPVRATAPSLSEFAALIAIGVLGGVAQIFLTRAYMGAPASFIAPFEYSAIVWAVLLGWALWGDAPDAVVILGAAIVAAAGLAVAWEPRRGGADAG